MSATRTFLLMLLPTLLVLPARAELRRFEARVDESTWKVSSSALNCSLSHPIPGFGRARFISRHGKDGNLQFELQSEFRSLSAGEVAMRSMAPGWLPGLDTDDLGSASISAGQTLVQLRSTQAHRVLSELEMGRLPTFSYEGASHSGATVVGVSSVNFIDAAAKFRRCVSNLLPFTFADIARSVVYFEFDTVELSPAGRARLNQVRDYLTADKTIELMVIEGHTDYQGGRWFNQQLGLKRAEFVRDYLLKTGIDAKRIKVGSKGERKPAASNKTEKGRELNRRVVIQISK